MWGRRNSIAFSHIEKYKNFRDLFRPLQIEIYLSLLSCLAVEPTSIDLRLIIRAFSGSYPCTRIANKLKIYVEPSLSLPVWPELVILREKATFSFFVRGLKKPSRAKNSISGTFWTEFFFEKGDIDKLELFFSWFWCYRHRQFWSQFDFHETSFLIFFESLKLTLVSATFSALIFFSQKLFDKLNFFETFVIKNTIKRIFFLVSCTFWKVFSRKFCFSRA